MLVTPITNSIGKVENKKTKEYFQNKQVTESTGSIAKLPAFADAKSLVNISFKGSSDLLSAAKSGNLERVIYELANGADINYRTRDYDYNSPLRQACYYEHVDIVNELLSHKEIDVNIRDYYQRTPLIVICKLGIESYILEALLNYPNIDVNAQDYEGKTSLYYAARVNHPKTVQALLKHPNIDVNLASNDNTTPLMSACSQGHKEVVELLLQCPDVDVNAADNDGDTPIMEAIRCGWAEVAKMLMDHPNIDLTIRNKDGKSAVDRARANYNTEQPFLKELTAKAIGQLRNPELIGNVNLSAVSIKLPPVDMDKLTPEENIWPVKTLTDEFIKMVASEKYDSAMKMLENCPIIDLDADNRKALTKVLRTCNPDFAEKVFDYKFHKQKQLAEEYITKREKFLNETIKTLDYENLKENHLALNTLDGLKILMSKPEFNPNDSIEGKTLFERVCIFDTEGELVKSILSKYDDVFVNNSKKTKNEVIKSLIENYEKEGKFKVKLENIKSKLSSAQTREAAVESLNDFVSSDGFKPEMTDSVGNDVLHIIAGVASDGSREIIQKVLDKGGQVDSLNIGKQTPIMSAIKGLMIAKTEDEKSGVLSNIKFLLDKGADVDAKDLNDQTVFHYVCRTLSVALLVMFLAKSPNVFIKDKYGNRAAKYLQSKEMQDVYQKYIMG